MKKSIVIVVALVLVLSIWAVSQYTTGKGDRAGVGGITGSAIREFSGEKILVDKTASKFEFEGYAVGKSHVFTFDDWSVNILQQDNKIVGIEGTINADSVNTGIDRLNTHLKSDDFFDTAVYPQITFTSTSIEDNIMTGELTFRGVTKEVTFPVVIDEDSISAEFYLDTTPFSMKYAAVNKEVRVAFDFVK